MEKTLNNTTANQAKDQVSDLEIWGTGDLWKLICKASSKEEGWMKSTKAMEIVGVGCLVQVTTQQGENISEAVTFVPGVHVAEYQTSGGDGGKKEVVCRQLEPGSPKEKDQTVEEYL